MRMSREFNLVLLGAGLLTAGSFLVPDDDPAGTADNPANAGGGSGTRSRGARVFFFASATRPVRPVAASSTVRGGFGRIGTGISGG